ncbi:hypothetical protein ACLOJK_007307, partial [Asimina triloba]
GANKSNTHLPHFRSAAMAAEPITVRPTRAVRASSAVHPRLEHRPPFHAPNAHHVGHPRSSGQAPTTHHAQHPTSTHHAHEPWNQIPSGC